MSENFTLFSDDTREFAYIRHETIQNISMEDRHTVKRLYCQEQIVAYLREITDKQTALFFNKYFKDRVLLQTSSEKTLSSFPSDICKTARVLIRYTPHCLKATSISFMNVRPWIRGQEHNVYIKLQKREFNIIIQSFFFNTP